MSPATGGVHPARRTDALTLRCPPCLPPRVQDSFETGSKLAMASGATSNYIPDSRGVQAAWSDLSGSTKRARSSLRAGHALSAAEKSDYLKGFNSAEKDFRVNTSSEWKPNELMLKSFFQSTDAEYRRTHPVEVFSDFKVIHQEGQGSKNVATKSIQKDIDEQED